MKITVVQISAKPNKKDNLDSIAALIKQASQSDQPDLIALPEAFHFMGGTLDEKRAVAEDFTDISNAPALQLLSHLAKAEKVWIHGGSVSERVGDTLFNTTPIFNPNGELVTTYRKIHLFIANFDRLLEANESHFYTAGDKPVTYDCMGARMGCSICYDLRFPELYQHYYRDQATVLFAPAAFLKRTGVAHWKLLCRARAVETQSFLVAPNQCGTLIQDGKERENWGHSLIVNPWGDILVEMGEEVGYATATLDTQEADKLRETIPLHLAKKL